MIEHSRGLSRTALDAIAQLERRCIEVDGGRLKLEWGALNGREPGEVNDVLWWSDERLLGFGGRYSFGGQTPEITGMVDPSSRRRGIGNSLLVELLSLCRQHGDHQVLLVTARASADAARLAERHGATFHHAEHALVLSALRGEGRSDAAVTLRAATVEDAPAMVALLESGFGEAMGLGDGDVPHPGTLVAERDGHVVATLRITNEPHAQGVYGFVVDPALRGRGVGRDLLRRVCEQALREGRSTVHLEVETTNDRALGLYTSMGFELQATEDYYRFEL